MTDNGAKALAERLDDIGMGLNHQFNVTTARVLLATGAAFLPDASELERLRRIEAAARDAVDAAGTERWPVNCDALRAALDPEPQP